MLSIIGENEGARGAVARHLAIPRHLKVLTLTDEPDVSPKNLIGSYEFELL
jgi:hypothetical protein